ncbi:MAG: type IV toxin-antitoxin system AbiEi family antitoxin domain-containing protein [Gammaproteobacteria bacterium]|jgi:predicted transcriptional regulator of viral defense system
MRYTILSAFEGLPYFTIEGFRQIAGDDVVDDAHARTALYRWVKAGHLIALKKGVYMHRRFYEQHRQDAAFAPAVSAILLPQSYLSLEYVLQQHGILTEITYPVTAITIKNTRTITNALGTFVYRHIQPDLYFGFQIMEAYGVPYAQASAARGLFDYLYLRPLPADLESQRYNLAEELRLNLEEFTWEEREKFAEYVFKSETIRKGGAKMRQILNNLEIHVWQR